MANQTNARFFGLVALAAAKKVRPMTEIDKLVEECAVLMRDMMGCGLHIEGKNTFCNDKRAPEEFRMACSCHEYARAVIRRTLEFAAGEIYPTHRRACACTRCDCGNSGDAQSVADWDARQDCSNHLRSLSPKAEG